MKTLRLPATTVLALLAACESTPQRAVYITPLGEPPPPIVYRDLTRPEIPPYVFPESPPAANTPAPAIPPAPEPIPEPEPVQVSDSAANDTPGPEIPPAEDPPQPREPQPDVVPQTASEPVAGSGTATDATAVCTDPWLDLAPGTLRTSLTQALSRDCGIEPARLSWKAGDTETILDWPLTEPVRVPLSGEAFSGLADWLEKRYPLTAAWHPETETLTVTDKP